MLLPYGTDAPLYHPPIITLLMIVLNTGIFFAEPLWHLVTNDPIQAFDRTSGALMDSERPVWDRAYKLEFGQGLKPWQWISSAFLHAHFPHLLGNMIFLWVFGLIVEGKLGWWKYLGLYLMIALVHGFVVQGLMLVVNPGNQQAALGASGVIYGLMGSSLIWAPWNTVQTAVVLYRRFVWHFDIPVIGLAGFYLLTDLFLTMLTFPHRGRFLPSTELLHTLGAVVGVGFGLLLLKRNLVDCENWDILSYAAGKHQMSYRELKASDTLLPEDMRTQGLLATGRTQIQAILRQGDNPQFAYKAHRRMQETYPNWRLPDGPFLILIKQLCQQQHFEDAVPAMQEYLQTGGLQKNQVRLKLASILIEPLELPRQASEVLGHVDQTQLSPREQKLLAGLIARVQREPNHLADDDW